MKRHLRSIVLLTLVCGAAAAAHAQFRYGPQLGANFTDMKFKQEIVGVGSGVGPSAALTCEFMFTSFGLGIDFGLGYSMSSARIDLGEKPIWSLQGYGNERVLVHNLQIPLHLRFKWTKMQGLEDYIAPFVYGGPDFNIQVGHSRHRRGDTSAFRFSGGDVSLTCGFGLELFKRWQASFGYSWGVTYSLKTRLLDDYSARTNGWNVKVAYFF